MSEDLNRMLPSLPKGFFWRVGKREGETRWLKTAGANLTVGGLPRRGYGISLREQTWYGSKALLRSGVVYFREDILREAARMEGNFRHEHSKREQEIQKNLDCGDYKGEA